MLGSLAGAVAGAIGANALEHKHKKHKEEKVYAQQPQPGYGGGAMGGLYPGYGGSEAGSSHHHGHHHHHHHSRHGSRSRSRSRSRGIDSDGSD